MTTRRDVLRVALGLGAAQVLAPRRAHAQTGSSPRKVTLKFWTSADNPVNVKMYTDSISMFHQAQRSIAIELDVSPTSIELRKKVVGAFAAKAGPDVIGMYGPHLQDYYDNGILQPLDEWFDKWDAKADFFPNVVEMMRGKPGQPILGIPSYLLLIILYYRADLLQAANLKPPGTLMELTEAAKRLTKAPDQYGYALRGGDYNGIQPVQSVWRSAGVQMVTEKGQVDFDSPAAVAVTEKWVGMLTKDKSAQPTAVSDRYSQLFALFQAGKVVMWQYPMLAQAQLDATFGERVQAVPPVRAGDKSYMECYPEGGTMMSTACKEKEAAWQFLMHMASGEPAKIFSRDRGGPPVRKSIAADPIFRQNRFFKLGLDSQPLWWVPPYTHKNWVKFQDGSVPYWQQAFRGEISPEVFHRACAKLLRGEA